MGRTSIYGCPVHGRLFVHERGWGIPGLGFGGGMGTLPRSCRKERVMNGAPEWREDHERGTRVARGS